MEMIPEAVKDAAIIPSLKNHLIHQDKIRDAYRIVYEGRNVLLTCATDRLACYGFVLNSIVPDKGKILTALAKFWTSKILPEFPNNLISSAIDSAKNYVCDLKEIFPEIPIDRCLVVEEVKIPPYGMKFRHYLGGSVYEEYLNTNMVGGQRLANHIPKWGYLLGPIFTPTIAGKNGRHVNISANDFFEETGQDGKKSVNMFMMAYAKAHAYALKKGIVILDTKFKGNNTLTEEDFTPDNCRFTTISQWSKAMIEKKDPKFFDNEIIRQWGRKVKTPFRKTGIHKLNPENSEHIDFVHGLQVPAEIIEKIRERNLNLFQLLTS